VFLGSELSAVLDELEKTAKIKVDKGDNVYMKLGINKIPPILLDNTDRNRTSPFAFTGNKFEFRAVGSSANSANPMTILNTIVADQLTKFKVEADKQIDRGVKKEVAIINILREYITKSKAIRFEGNGYSEDWKNEAKKRGLNNVPTSPHALDFYISSKATKVLVGNGIMSERELHARYEIMLESYVKKVQIESRIIADLASNHVIPTAIAYQNKLIDNLRGLKEIGMADKANKTLKDNIVQISKYIDSINEDVEAMIEERKKANNMEDGKEKAIAYCIEVKQYFEKIRYCVDKLEIMVDDEIWPLPKYREMLFIK